MCMQESESAIECPACGGNIAMVSTTFDGFTTVSAKCCGCGTCYNEGVTPGFIAKGGYLGFVRRMLKRWGRIPGNAVEPMMAESDEGSGRIKFRQYT